jgi:hypothetical protein
MHEDARRALKAFEDGRDTWIRLAPEVIADLGEDADTLLEAVDAFRSLDNGAGEAAADWLRTKALPMHGSTITYVRLLDGEVEGFYALCSASVRLSMGDRRRLFREAGVSVLELPSLQPASLVAWIAKRADASSDCGRQLLLHAFGSATSVAQIQGSIALVLDPFDEETARMWLSKRDVPFRRAARERGTDDARPRRLWTPLIPPHPASV